MAAPQETRSPCFLTVPCRRLVDNADPLLSQLLRLSVPRLQGTCILPTAAMEYVAKAFGRFEAARGLPHSYPHIAGPVALRQWSKIGTLPIFPWVPDRTLQALIPQSPGLCCALLYSDSNFFFIFFGQIYVHRRNGGCDPLCTGIRENAGSTLRPRNLPTARMGFFPKGIIEYTPR